ncbi:carbonic anhydrase 12-like, partial [Oppia nitens]|uniref:carbonic anhydrase 12-like n=1 Tax=Oppia nitens TaxID=1686743 RepID=UPI0023DBF23F
DESNWSKQFSQCGGRKQSPINIETKTLKNKEMSFKYYNYDNKNYVYNVLNTGYSISTIIQHSKTKPGIDFESTMYIFDRFHIHWGNQDDNGSEHSIDNKFSAAEIHLVHYNEKYESMEKAMTKPNGLLVIGVLAKLSLCPNINLNFLTKAAQKIYLYNSTLVIPSDDNFQLNQLLPNDKNGNYRYQGSFTIPPCFETVTWLLYKNPIAISSDQIKVFRDLQQSSGKKLLTNRRQIQSLNDRTVSIF